MSSKLDPPAEIIVKKRLPFTVLDIGGAQALYSWRAQKARQAEEVWAFSENKRLEKRQRAIEICCDLFTASTKEELVIKPSLIQKAINWFLNIKYEG